MKKILKVTFIFFLISEHGICADLSRWMGDLATSLPGFTDMRLTTIAMPGSHDALTSDIKKEKRAEGGLGVVAKIPLVGKTVLKLSKAQGDNIIDQFKNGARYFDLRIVKTEKGFEGVHGFYNGTIEKSFRDLKAFLDTRPTELILLDFQDVDTDDHGGLIDLMNTIFGDLIYRSTGPLTVSYGSLIQTNKRVIIFYKGKGIMQDTQNTVFARAQFLTSKWYNQTDPKKINDAILADVKKNPRNLSKINVIQAQTTPNVKSFVKGIIKSFIPFTSESSLKKDAAKSAAAQKALLAQTADNNELLKAINVFMVDYLNSTKSQQIIDLNKKKLS